MPTPKFDKLCIDFVKRIPDQLTNNFIPGSGTLPRSYLMSRDVIVDYINRALLTLFNNYWNAVKADASAFINIFPELVTITNSLTITNGKVTLNSPYKDIFKLIGGFVTLLPSEGSIKVSLKIADADKYSEYEVAKLTQYSATNSDPVAIQIKEEIYFFPKFNNVNTVLEYIKLPVLPTNGQYLIQNGNYDNPFSSQWDNEIVNIAYSIYASETAQTT